MNIAKLLLIAFFMEHLWWLLLPFMVSPVNNSIQVSKYFQFPSLVYTTVAILLKGNIEKKCFTVKFLPY